MTEPFFGFYDALTLEFLLAPYILVSFEGCFSSVTSTYWSSHSWSLALLSHGSEWHSVISDFKTYILTEICSLKFVYPSLYFVFLEIWHVVKSWRFNMVNWTLDCSFSLKNASKLFIPISVVDKLSLSFIVQESVLIVLPFHFPLRQVLLFSFHII